MNYYIITFQAIINGSEIKNGTIGSSTPTTDYKPTIVKGIVEKYYRKRIPDAKTIAVVIISANPVSVDDYKKAIPGFIDTP